ncbi:hypothetical protein [Diaphorobacter aerolatus]|uniref:TolC family protein n=1 Tax=Diaphorobacter aerolatus TaxID=1288495 RepID=A0A7H0GQX4_9BURK|nr:hypothetical protein [Diaphorobacter aerolatus]QNP50690.1 hypothetical protein H9K75_03780 [Diaphorobacter aerolatus]
MLFDVPELNRLVEQALRDSTEARMAVARMREARAIREAALTQYRPRVVWTQESSAVVPAGWKAPRATARRWILARRTVQHSG